MHGVLCRPWLMVLWMEVISYEFHLDVLLGCSLLLPVVFVRDLCDVCYTFLWVQMVSIIDCRCLFMSAV